MRHVNTLAWCWSAHRELIGSTLFLLLVTSAAAQTDKIPFGAPAAPSPKTALSAASLETEGDRLLREGNVKAAAVSYLRAAQSAPTQPLLQITAGVALASAGRMNEALAAFRRADNLAKGEDVIASFLVQGILSERSEDSEEAQTLYTRTVRRFSRPGASGLDTASSTAQLMAAQKQFPQSPILWLLLGDSYQLAEQWANAESAYRQAIRLAPTWVKPRINLGLGQIAQGSSSQAIASFQGALDLDPANAQAQIAKADAQLQSGFVDDAVLSYRKVENSTNNRVAAQAATGIGQAYAQRGQVNEAVKSLNRAKELSPLDPAPPAAIGVVQAQAGNYSAAAQAYGEALRLSRGGLFASKGVLYRALAETQISARNSEGAISTLGRAITEEPANKPLWYRLWAQALFLRNDTSGGEEKLKQALEAEGSRYPLEVLNALEARHLIDKLTSEYLTNLSVTKNSAAKIRLLRPLISLVRFQEKTEAEVRCREMLVALKPTGMEWFALADARERNNDIKGARSAYQKAVELDGLTPTALKQAKARLAGRITP